MKAVIKSLHPEACERIASGRQKFILSKSAPKEVLFKAYIYCTKAGKMFFHNNIGEKQVLFFNPDTKEYKFDYSFELICCKNKYSKDNFLSGKVIGEFICDKVYDLFPWGVGVGATDERGELVIPDVIRNNSCLTDDEICEYLNHRAGKAWHISDLKIYDTPKELGEFFTRRSNKTDNCDTCINKKWWKEDTAEIAKSICAPCQKDNFRKQITRPPQSWQYVEEI